MGYNSEVGLVIKKINEKEKPTYIQFPKVWDGEINIQIKRQNLAKHKNGSTEFLFIVITEMKSNAENKSHPWALRIDTLERVYCVNGAADTPLHLGRYLVCMEGFTKLYS